MSSRPCSLPFQRRPSPPLRPRRPLPRPPPSRTTGATTSRATATRTTMTTTAKVAPRLRRRRASRGRRQEGRKWRSARAVVRPPCRSIRACGPWNRIELASPRSGCRSSPCRSCLLAAPAGRLSLTLVLLDRLDASIARRILVILHHQVLPNMTQGRAVRTADWLGAWVDRGRFFPSYARGTQQAHAHQTVHALSRWTPRPPRPQRVVHLDDSVQSVRTSSLHVHPHIASTC